MLNLEGAADHFQKTYNVEESERLIQSFKQYSAEALSLADFGRAVYKFEKENGEAAATVLLNYLNQQNSAIPKKNNLFSPVWDEKGPRQALVFVNEIGECPFYTRKECNFCDIGAGEGYEGTKEINEQRFGFLRGYHGLDRIGETAIKHLIVYNSGSTLSRKEFGESLEVVLGLASQLPHVECISLDSRELYVNERSLEAAVSSIKYYQQIRIILGVEVGDENVRMKTLEKCMSDEKMKAMFSRIKDYNAKLPDGRKKVGVDVNVLFGAPGIEDPVKDAVQLERYVESISGGVEVDYNFHAFYQSEVSRQKHPDHQRADPKQAIEAIKQMKQLTKGMIFVGWQDEGHDQQSVERSRELELFQQKFSAFNISQNIGVFENEN